MSSINATLEIAKNTLLNSQVQISTASHNIANADNKSYARQKAVLETNPPYEMYAGFLGMGARISTVIQQRDQFIEKSLIGSISKESDYKARSFYLDTASAQLFDNGETGLSSTLGAFWDAWDALSRNPSGLSEKTVVKQTSQNLANAIKDAASGLAGVAADVEGEVQDEVSTVNTLLTNIAGYNEQIATNEIGGHPANDLRDLRYEALTKLAESVPISYKEEVDGTLTITLKDYSSDITLVSTNQAGSLTYDTTNHRVTYSDYQGTAYPAPPDPVPPDQNQLSGGQLNGLLTVYRSIGTSHSLAYVQANPDASDITYLDRLNAFASNIITEVNAAHGSTIFTGNDASDIGFDAATVTLDPTQALNISDLQNKNLVSLGNSAFSGYLSDIQQRLGLDQQNANNLGAFQTALRQQLETQQQSVSGVSMDEEMIDMLKFQQVYQAAAKIIETTAGMLNAVIDMV